MVMPTERVSLWERLAQTEKPVVLYGMGDGADKILKICPDRQIPVAGVFASDGFCRGQAFGQYTVLSYEQAKAAFKDMSVLLAFGTNRPDVIETIGRISAEQELYAPDVPVFGGGLFDLGYFDANKEKLDEAYAMLADEQSKKVFACILNYRISGKIRYLKECETKAEEAFENILKLSGEETYLDAGAYTGDTVMEFINRAGSCRRIIAIEPDGKNFAKLQANTAGIKNIECLQLGVHREAGELPFAARAGRSSYFDEAGAGRAAADSIDHILNGEPVTFMKLDVEGQEADAVWGAENTIAGGKPKLQVAAYHRNGDIFAVPLQIKKIRPDYRVYLRHLPCIPAWDTYYYFV